MAKEKYQTRLEEVDAERVDEFQDELGISTKAEATRRLILAGLDEHELDDSDEETDSEKQVATDGGGAVLEPFLTQMAHIYRAATVVLSSLYVLKFLEIVELSVFGLSQLWGASIAAFVLWLVCVGLLYSGIPEAADRALYTRVHSLREVSPMGGERQ